MRVVIVGAGVAGLYAAAELQNRYEHVTLLEARPTPGGRVRTSYDATTKTVEYEAGPWRVPSDHRRVRALFQRHDLPLVPIATPTPPHSRVSRVRTGMSIWDSHVLDGDVTRADAADRATGYADQTTAASGTDPYTTGSRTFFVCPDGFSALANRMASTVRDLRYDHRVADVVMHETTFTVRVSRRAGPTRFEMSTLECDLLVVCVPPTVSKEWTALREHARSTLCAVTEGALSHIYVRAPHPPATHVRCPDSTLAQTISSQYGNDWFQASYSGGRIAQFWHHLRSQSVSRFKTVLYETLRRRMGIVVSSDAEHRAHYWPCAYHLWRPAPGFDMRRAVRHAVQPNPKSCPNLFFAGEAFSSHQAWMEGAVETAEMVLETIVHGGDSPALDNETRIDGRPVDVRAWSQSHPGGARALENHAGEDLGVYMRHVGHSDQAWAFANAMKR